MKTLDYETNDGNGYVNLRFDFLFSSLLNCSVTVQSLFVPMVNYNYMTYYHIFVQPQNPDTE